jgi:hypothetical protein
MVQCNQRERERSLRRQAASGPDIAWRKPHTWVRLHMKQPSRLLVCALMLAAACGGEPAARNDVPVVTGTPDTGASAAQSNTGSCRLSGLWQVCSAEDRLTRAGLVLARRSDPARVDFFSVPAVVFGVGARDDRVEIFIFPDAEARKLATDAVDTLLVAPRGERRSWPAAARLVTSANLAAVIFSDNPRTTERLELALSGGLPPSRP